MEIAERVKKTISQQLDVDMSLVLNESKFIEDLQADSLAVVEMVLAFEDEFDIEIPDEAAEEIQTVGDAVQYIEKHLAEGAEA